MLGASAWVGRDWLLLSAVNLWIVSDPIAPADAVAVFGGGLAYRSMAAAYYYREGLVNRVLVANVRQRPPGIPNTLVSDVTVTREILVGHGVPPSAIETFGN